MNKKRILIAEDDNIIAMEIQSRLEEKGYIVIGPYAYGEEVIKDIENFDVDLILMDINLKGNLDGIQTAHIIKEKYRKPIIYLTAFTDNKTIERAKITEPFGYIVKPFEERELFTNIEMALYKHKIECELIDRNQQYQELIELAVDGILLGSKDGYIINANSQFCLISGRNKEDLIGRHITDSIFTVESVEKAPMRFDLLLKGEVVVSERKIIRPNGYQISIEMRTKMMPNATYQSILRDITVRKKLEKSLIISEGNLKLLNTSLSDMLSVQDLSIIYQNIVNVLSEKFSNTVILCISIDEKNKETKLESIGGIDDTLFQNVLNVSGFNIVGRRFKLHPSLYNYFSIGKLLEFSGSLAEFTCGEFPAIAAQAIEKMIGLHKIYTIGINKDNNLLAAIHFFTLKDMEIKEIDFVETFVKQTGTVIQKIMAQDALEQSKNELLEINLAKDKFFSIIAHDLKSPFNGFLGLTKIMSEEAQDLTQEEIQSFSINLYKSANNMYSLLENLLEWSKIQRGFIQFEPKRISLISLIKQSLSFINDSAIQKEIVISNQLSHDIEVFADESMINSVLRNLLTNAIKFSHRGGRIEIGSCKTKSLSNKEICIFIRDNGIGIDSMTISKLFKLEEKVSRQGTELEPSTGLGLLLCNEFINKNGGKIWVESEIGFGSTFFFTLPRIN